MKPGFDLRQCAAGATGPSRIAANGAPVSAADSLPVAPETDRIIRPRLTQRASGFCLF
jgi:hypothetical protein